MGPHRARGWRSYDLVGIFGPVLPAKRRFLAQRKTEWPPMLRFRYSRSFAQRTSAPRSASIRGTDEHVPLQTSSLSKPRHGLLIKDPCVFPLSGQRARVVANPRSSARLLPPFFLPFLPSLPLPRLTLPLSISIRPSCRPTHQKSWRASHSAVRTRPP